MAPRPADGGRRDIECSEKIRVQRDLQFFPAHPQSLLLFTHTVFSLPNFQHIQAKFRIEETAFGVKPNQLQMSYNISIAGLDQTNRPCVFQPSNKSP